MKKILFSLLLFVFMLFPLSVFAEGYVSVSPNTLTIEKGSTKTFTISVYNAIGDVYISSNNSNVAQVSINEWGTGMVEEKQSKSTTVTVTGLNIGSTTITLNIDAATFDSEDLSGQTKTITVNVIEKTTTTTTTTSTTTKTNPQNTTNKITTKTTTKNENNTTTTSSQNKLYLKNLKVENYELDFKKEQFEYELIVENNVNKLNIDYELEDKNSKVDIIGAENLVEGKNKVEISVTNNNIKTTYIINVNRKTAISDIENNEEIILNALTQDINELSVKVDINDNNKIISTKILEILKNNKKDIVYNVYDNDNIIYSYKIIGNNINKTDSINFNIKLHSDYSDNINKLVKNKENLVINFDYTGILPKDTEIVIYDIKNIVDDGYLYYYNSNKNELEYVDNVEIENNKLILKLEQSDSEYILLNKKITNSTMILFIIGTIIYGLVIVVIIVYFVMFIKKNKSKKIETL